LNTAGISTVWVENRRVAVGLGERIRQRPASQPVDLDEHVARGVGVHRGERSDAHALLHAEHLEQHELQIAEITLVVPHVLAPTNAVLATGLLTGNNTIYRLVT
jgi:hypothetical protein